MKTYYSYYSHLDQVNFIFTMKYTIKYVVQIQTILLIINTGERVQPDLNCRIGNTAIFILRSNS